jgi:hypothetical protein
VSYRFYRILCPAPKELERERQVFDAAIGKFNEEVTMADGILFAPASVAPPYSAARHRPAVEANIRICDFFVQVLDERPPDEVFRGYIGYAIQQARDSAATMSKAAVFFRTTSGAAAEAAAYRDTLAADGGCEVLEFRDETDLAVKLRELLEKWYVPLRPQATR